MGINYACMFLSNSMVILFTQGVNGTKGDMGVKGDNGGVGPKGLEVCSSVYIVYRRLNVCNSS